MSALDIQKAKAYISDVFENSALPAICKYIGKIFCPFLSMKKYMFLYFDLCSIAISNRFRNSKPIPCL